MIRTYQASGKCSPLFFVIVAVFTALLVALAMPYQVMLEVIPLIFLNLGLVLTYCCLLGVAMAGAARIGKCRNGAISGLVALGVGLVVVVATHFAGYLLFIDEVAEAQQLAADVLRAEIPFMEYLKFRAEAGWSLGRRGTSASLTGIMVWGVWGLEALAFVGSAVMGASLSASLPFCEKCNRWTEDEDEKENIAFRGPSHEMLERIQSTTQFHELLIPDQDPETAPFLTVLYKRVHCSTCSDSTYMNVQLQTLEVDDEGKENTREDELRLDVHIGPQEAELLREFALLASTPPAVDGTLPDEPAI